MAEYSVRDYAEMLQDARRVHAYHRALQLAVTPNSVVLDLGAGLGVFGFFASLAGARKVYAIEPSGAIGVARDLAAANGIVEKIEFIEDLSTRVTLPEQADVIVSDIGGASPVFEYHVPSIVDARKRHLKPGGILIPSQDTLIASVVAAPEAFEKIAPTSVEPFGLKMEKAWRMAANKPVKLRASVNDLLTSPAEVAVLNYHEIEEANVHSQLSWPVERAGIAHGIHLWFDRIVADGIAYSTGPHEPAMVYGALFFPWPEPVSMLVGDTVELEIRADLQTESYIWTWNTWIRHGGELTKTFRQSEFFGEARGLERLRKQAAAYVPAVNDEGELHRRALQLMNGTLSVEQIAQEMHAAFPARFATLNQAIGWVGDLSRRYSR